MSLLKRIKDDQLKARLNREATRTSFLTTLYSEAAMVGKDDGNRESTDSEVLAVLRKFAKNINEVLNNVDENDPRYTYALTEMRMLSEYQPKQLDEQELRTIINDYIISAELEGMQNMGKVMGYLKENYDGQYDGKMASSIVKELLS